MPSGNAFYFAWCAIGEPFDPEVHNRVDDRALSIFVRHEEFGRRTAAVEFPAAYGGAQLEGREACHISLNVNGVIQHLFYGTVVKSPNGQRWQQTTAEFEAKHPDDIQLQADVLQPIFNDPILYIPQIEEAQDALDAEVALKASTLQMEFSKDGTPYLNSIFGDSSRLKVISGARIVAESFDPTYEMAPPRAAVCTLELSAIDRWAGFIECDNAIQDEINRIGNHYGILPFEGNFTFTPDILKNWPKPGSTISGSYVVTDSEIRATDGPGTNPPSVSSLAPVMVDEPNETVSGVPEDAADYAADKSRIALFPTSFSSPRLRLYGVRTKKRREVITISVPFAGQELVPDNAEPVYLNLSASDLDVDNTVDEWQAGEYAAGARASVSGYVFQSSVNHQGREGLLNDIYDYDPFSPTNGEMLWDPVLMNNSLLGYPNTSQIATSAFGRRAIQYAIRRCVATLGLACRVSTNPIVVPVEDVWDLDTGWTVRMVSEFIKGGQLEGKVGSIEIAADGNGNASAAIQVVSAIGNGNPGDEFEDPEDDGTGAGGQTPGTEYPVATYGGPWDIVRYQAPIYYVTPLGSPEAEISVHIDWLGAEQQWSLNNPGELVWDPYGKIPGPDGQYPARFHYYVDNAVDIEGNPIGSDAWLGDHATSISISIPAADEDDAKPVYLSVPIVYGWRGPRQVEL